MNPLYPAVAERAGERCEYCSAPEQVFNFAFEVEHVLPRSVGGSDDLDNLALACDLKLNSAFQLRARRHWAQLGLYP